MKQIQGFSRIMLGGAAVLMAIQPAVAQPVQVTGVEVKPTQNGVDVVLRTQAGERPQVFAVNRGNSWTADITNTQLKLSGGGSFRQENAAPGIPLITVAPLDSNSVRVTVVGQAGAPVGQVNRPGQGELLISINRAGGSQAAAPAPAPAASPAPAAPPASPTPAAPAAPPPASNQPASNRPGAVAQAPTPIVPGSNAPVPAPLVPNPEISIQGPGAAAVPPTLPRAIAPPVGDIAAAQTDASASSIDLGTAERVPRLVLRDAPAREVLSLLARAAGLNIAYSDANAQSQQQQQRQQQQQGAAAEGPRISLDVENEAVQDVFNYVLRITGLEANRVGRTIFVGPRLPNTARNVIVRTLRLNQVPVTSALNFLVTLGAESAVSRERLITSVNAVPVAQLAGGGQSSAITQTQTTTESRIENQRVAYVDSTPILRGLQVSGDERTNQVTLVGTPRQIEVAVAQLSQLDVRRRQVAVNVKVIDVNLLALDQFSTSFSFGLGPSRFLNDAGSFLFNFGNRAPANSGIGLTGNAFNSGFGTTTSIEASQPFDFTRNFLLQLQAQVTNGNAKILTDPTLVVQEGQTATVNLTQEVVTNFQQQVTASEGATTTTITVEKARAGLILGVKIDRIDDNGFVALSVAPSISAPEGTQSVNINTNGNNSQNVITLLSERRLESGQIRLRDGQTLILSGIIQDQDRVSVRKVPILGDIPLLGALFRRSERNNQRREVIVILTPRVLDDSDRSTYGYGYTPGPATQRVLDQQQQQNQQPR